VPPESTGSKGSSQERASGGGRVEEQLALPQTRRSAIMPVTSASLILILVDATAGGTKTLAGRATLSSTVEK